MPTVILTDYDPDLLTARTKGGRSEPCPTCGARPGGGCVTPSGRTSPTIHVPRTEAWFQRLRTDWFLVRTFDHDDAGDEVFLARANPADPHTSCVLLAGLPDGYDPGRRTYLLAEVEWLGFATGTAGAA